MAADNKYWFQGLPYTGVFDGTTDPGTIKYWFQGLPATFIEPFTAPSTVKFRRTLSEAGTRIGKRQTVS